MKHSPLKRRTPLRAKRPNYGERITSRAGLLWRNGAVIPLPEADTVARAHGYGTAEAMVRALRDGTESVLSRVRKERDWTGNTVRHVSGWTGICVRDEGKFITVDRPGEMVERETMYRSGFTLVRKARKPLARSKHDPIYEKAVREWWAGHDGRCEMRYDAEGVHLPRVPDGFDPRKTIDPFRCYREANPRPHHSKKRGKFKSDKSTFLGLCDSCHLVWLHNNEEEARRLGYLTDRKPKPTP